MKPRRDIDSLPSEYNDDHFPYHPPGSIPTPVLLAQKIAENKAGGTSNLPPPSLQRHQSMESEKPQSYSSDVPVKQGPPTSAKPTRFPANISVVHSIKDHQNQSGANVNINERRAQMLANLAGTSHPLLQEDSQQTAEQSSRNAPPLTTELNTYGGKSRTINPSSGLSRPLEGQAKTLKPPAPTPAPKPHRHTIHVPAEKAAPKPPEHRGRSGSMFRPQGITVQFSGRGPMNDSRREALRKLGLLKDS
uniref:Proline and serine rich 2 n=1 Tax=Anabas testudineus TaxID=64144 RepID=A0A3Q1J903_ANATE